MLNAEVFDDDLSYKLSLYIEPRGGAEPSGEKPAQLHHVEVPRAVQRGLTSVFKRSNKQV